MSWFKKAKETVSEAEELLEDVSADMKDMMENLDKISEGIKDIQDTMVKLWRAEDMEENDGEFRWPFDEHGNLLDNVNLSKRLN
tara:strand:- start:3341 stop:3592 length:252 start_codon:yes stop_codon:yes gene_type:complete